MHKTLVTPLTALDAIFVRRSVRSFTADRLDQATVQALLDAAVQAPTAMHAEPWAFVVVQDAVILKRYSDEAKGAWTTQANHYRDLHVPGDPSLGSRFVQQMSRPDFCIFYDASTLIVICARRLGPFVEADCWLAAENLMLAAVALGLGTCCIGSALPVLNTPHVRAELHIPADVMPVAPIIVGVPRGTTEPVSRKTADILAWL